MREVIGFALVGAGLFAMLSAVVGVLRWKYVLDRMHAAALADTMGIALVCAGCAVLRGLCTATGKFALLVVFLWMTSPVASHLIAKAEFMTQGSPEKHWEEEAQ